MLLRTALATAVLFTAVPVLASPVASLAQAEKDATTRCMMRQTHAPSGRGSGPIATNCTQVARAEVAALVKQQQVASREASKTDGRD